MTQLRNFTLLLMGLIVLLTELPMQAQSTRTYQVSIETVPPGATVYLDDKTKGPIGYTPLKPKIKEGTHTLILELEGYETQRVTLIIDKTAYKKTFSYTLVKAVKLPTIEVRAKSGDPSADGAEVFVDGALLGNVPVSKQSQLGRHLVEVKKTDFVTYSEWVDLKEGETRTISASLEAIKKDATLKVEGTAGAQVLVDGILKGNIPAVIPGISPGRHFIEVKKEGFESLGQWTEFRNGATETVNATLAPAAPKVQFGTIKVFAPDQDPADVYLDGDLQGKSPILLDKIPPGDHFISVKKEGYKTYEQQLKVENNQNLVLKIALESNGPKTGTVRVISPQVEAQVFIDGNLVGPVPVEKAGLSKGDHFIVVKKPGFRDWEKKITIDDKTPAMELVAELVASGNVKLLTNLEGADVFIDGEKRAEKSPPEGTPLELKDLAVGQHTILVRLKDYKEFNETISLAAGETKLVQIKLVKMGPTIEELLFRRRTISTYSAKALYPGNLAVDLMAGIPYFAEIRFSTNLQNPDPNETSLPLDIGVDLKIAGSINEIYARGKYQLVATPVFGAAVEGSAGVGLGLAKTADGTNFSANSFNLLGTGVASLFFRDILTVSARLGLHFYTDGSKGEGFVEAQTTKGETGRDNGARLMLGIATQIHKNNKISYNILLNGNPGKIGDQNGRTMFDLALPFTDPLLYLQAGATLKF